MIGKKAPSFCLPNQDDKEICLKDFSGSWLVLYFYPKDNTPGCTLEGRDFSTLLPSFEKLGARVVGVSKDSVASHCKFIEKQDLKVDLLSDESGKMITAYGAFGLKKFMGREYQGIKRNTVLVDPTGKVAFAWENVRAKGHAQTVLEKLETLV